MPEPLHPRQPHLPRAPLQQAGPVGRRGAAPGGARRGDEPGGDLLAAELPQGARGEGHDDDGDIHARQALLCRGFPGL